MPPEALSISHPRRGQRILIGAVLLLAACAAGYAVVQARQMPRRFSVVEPGVLYRSSQPKVGQLKRLVERYGIRTVIVARETSERVRQEEEFGRDAGVRIVQIPVESRTEVAAEQISEFMRIVDDPRNRPVLVHCAAGLHRTGLLCALYRVERQGWPPQRAREEMLSFGFDARSESAVLKQFDQYVEARQIGATPRASGRGT